MLANAGHRGGVRYESLSAVSSDAIAPLCVPGLPKGHRLRVHGDEDAVISRRLRDTGIWEPFETELLRRSLKPGAICLDVGANLGYFTVLAAAWAGARGHVYAFEPEPRNFALLEANLALNGLADRVTTSAAALSDHAGIGHLHLNPENFGDHRLAGADPAALEVELVEGALWFAGREQRLDLVKIDVQGAEHAAIRGLLPLLADSGQALKLLVELTPSALRAAGTSGAALIETLASLRLPFHIVDHIEHRLAPTTAAALATWSDNLDACGEEGGFMNIFLGSAV